MSFNYLQLTYLLVETAYFENIVYYTKLKKITFKESASISATRSKVFTNLTMVFWGSKYTDPIGLSIPLFLLHFTQNLCIYLILHISLRVVLLKITSNPYRYFTNLALRWSAREIIRAHKERDMTRSSKHFLSRPWFFAIASRAFAKKNEERAAESGTQMLIVR